LVVLKTRFVYAADIKYDVICSNWLVCDAVQVNERESIIIGSWAARVQYDAFCHALGTGMSIHLQVYRLVVCNYVNSRSALRRACIYGIKGTNRLV